MPKRAAVDASPGPDKVSRSTSSQAREKPVADEMGEFEDAWEDEIEGDEEDGDGAILFLSHRTPRRIIIRLQAWRWTTGSCLP